MVAADVVVVSRDGDDRKGFAAAVDLRDPIGTTVTGGRRRQLDREWLAVIVDCDRVTVPLGGSFAHACEHGSGPHPIRVLIHEDETPGEVVAMLRAVVAGRKVPAKVRRLVAAVHDGEERS